MRRLSPGHLTIVATWPATRPHRRPTVGTGVALALPSPPCAPRAGSVLKRMERSRRVAEAFALT